MVKIEKSDTYFSVSQVAQMYNMNTSSVLYWCNKNRSPAKGARHGSLKKCIECTKISKGSIISLSSLANSVQIKDQDSWVPCPDNKKLLDDNKYLGVFIKKGNYYTVPEAARLLSAYPMRVLRMIKGSELESMRVPEGHLIEKASLDSYIKNRDANRITTS